MLEHVLDTARLLDGSRLCVVVGHEAEQVKSSISEISLGQVLMRLFDVSREFNVSVQPQLVLLQKTLLNVEGMGRVLDPDLDLWQTAKPFLEKWMR